MKTQRFVHKPLYVEALQVTAANMADVAAWCEGEVIASYPRDKKRVDYIKVPVLRPNTQRQTQAYVRDWVLFDGTGFKVYGDKAFRNSFNEVTEEVWAKVAKQIVEETILEPART